MKRVLCALMAAAVTLTACLCGCSDDGKQRSQVATASNNSAATADEPLTETTVATTGNKIHISDNTLGDIWITELDGVEKNTLSAENFTADNNFKYYSEDGKPASEEGIDISSFSGDIDWTKVKSSGVDFVMVRIGGRGYGDKGELYADERALEYMKDAHNVGLKVGAYFFSQAITTAEAVEEADYVKGILGDTTLEYPVAFDWEIIKNDNARTDTVSSTQATECARAFCERITEYGYKPMIYAPSRELYFKYDLTRLSNYDIWYCEYANVPEFYYQFTMWQYSETGHVDGIDGAVDLNICFTNIADYE